MIAMPIHIGTINGKPVRFFKTPNTDGRPDFAWHSTEDLMRAANLPPAMIEHFMRGSKADHGAVYRTIATPDGLVTIAPHCAGQGFTQAMAHVGRAPSNFYDEYTTAAIAADDKLPIKGFDGIVEAFHRHSGATSNKGN